MKSEETFKMPGIGTVVFQHRQKLGWSQRILAKKIEGLSQSQISMLESGRLDVVSEENLRSILQILEVDTFSLQDRLNAKVMVRGACPNPQCPSLCLSPLGSNLIPVPTVFQMSVGVGFSLNDLLCPCCGKPLLTRCFGKDGECEGVISPGIAHCLSCGEKLLEGNADALPESIAADYQCIREAGATAGKPLFVAVEELAAAYEKQRRKHLRGNALLKLSPDAGDQDHIVFLVSYEYPIPRSPGATELRLVGKGSAPRAVAL